MTSERRRYGVRKSLAIGLAAASLAAPSALAVPGEFTSIDEREQVTLQLRRGGPGGVAEHTVRAHEVPARANQMSNDNQVVSEDAMRAYTAAFQAYKDSKKLEAMRDYNVAIQSEGPDTFATKVRALEAASERFPANTAAAPQTPVVFQSDDGVSWRDASIGAAIAAIVVLAGVAIALFLRSRPPVAPSH